MALLGKRTRKASATVGTPASAPEPTGEATAAPVIVDTLPEPTNPTDVPVIDVERTTAAPAPHYTEEDEWV